MIASFKNGCSTLMVWSLFSLSLSCHLFASSSTEDSDSSSSSSSSLNRTLEELQAKITRSHAKRNVPKLLELRDSFNDLSYNRDQWKAQAERLEVEKWPSQSWKQSVGGHLFYPAQTDHFLSCDSTSHLITRRDMLWAFAIAASHKHPLAQYYLARGLDQGHHRSSSRPALITRLYRTSLDILEKCSHHPQACYILALNHACHAPKVGMREFDLDRALALHEKGAEHDSLAGKQNHVARLVKHSVYYRYTSPQSKDYKAIDKYGPAYVKAAHLTKRSQKKVKLLEEAASYGFPQAYLSLGALHDKKAREAEATKAYEEAGRQGVPRGYILLSQRLIGDPSLRQNSQDLTQITPEKIEQAKRYLRQAGEAGDYEGWDQLVSLQEKLYELYQNEEDLRELITALEKGLEMGSSQAHHKSRRMFPTKYAHLVSQYGDPSHRDLHEYMDQVFGEGASS